MQGKIVKGISGFYYVHVGEPGIYECKAKGAFRNQKINLNIKKPNNESVTAANIYLYDGADGTGNILEQWTNQSISLFGEDGLSISKSGMLASSGSLKIDWLGADGQQLGSSQIVSPISFKAE